MVEGWIVQKSPFSELSKLASLRLSKEKIMLVSQTQNTKYLSVKINVKFECSLLLIESKASSSEMLLMF